MITIGSYSFEGPFNTASDLQNTSGVYCILTLDPSNRYTVIDVGESDDVRYRVETHEREDCWNRNDENGIYYSAYYCDENDREEIGLELREEYDPVCGEI